MVKDRLGLALRGMRRSGLAVMVGLDWLGLVVLVEAVRAWCGTSGLGAACPDMAVKDRLGLALRGMRRPGLAVCHR